jgi:hypothetical protein
MSAIAESAKVKLHTKGIWLETFVIKQSNRNPAPKKKALPKSNSACLSEAC